MSRRLTTHCSAVQLMQANELAKDNLSWGCTQRALFYLAQPTLLVSTPFQVSIM